MSFFPEGSMKFVGARNIVKQKQAADQSPSVSNLRGHGVGSSDRE